MKTFKRIIGIIVLVMALMACDESGIGPDRNPDDVVAPMDFNATAKAVRSLQNVLGGDVEQTLVKIIGEGESNLLNQFSLTLSQYEAYHAGDEEFEIYDGTFRLENTEGDVLQGVYQGRGFRTNGFLEMEQKWQVNQAIGSYACLLYTSPSPRDRQKSRMPSSA